MRAWRIALLAVVAVVSVVPTAGAGPLSGKTVVIDPGHNGGNSSHPEIVGKQVWAGTRWKNCDANGAVTPSGYSEAQHNWDVALLVQTMLTKQGARVILTRQSNAGVGPCITKRVAISNQARADAAISIHADGSLNTSNTGFHVIVPGPAGQSRRMLRLSHDLGILMRDALRDQGPTAISNYIGENGLIERRDLGGLNLSTVPKVFIEIGNMRAPRDYRVLESAAGRQREAAAIVVGLTRFLLQRHA